MKHYTLFACIAGLIFLYSNNLSAQKLSNIQNQSRWLPSDVKADGKLTEWNDVLMAYQKSNHLEYTIANDSTRLYFAFRSRDKATTAKILAGGISMLLNPSGKKTKGEGPEITFPINTAGFSRGGREGVVRRDFAILTDSASIINAMTKFKEIALARVPGISDQTLSIYNEYGVKMQLHYAGGALTGEYLFPLKLLGIKPGSAFSYNIKLNGVQRPAANNSVPPPPMTLSAGRGPGSIQAMEIEISAPTNFWGNYKLLSN